MNAIIETRERRQFEDWEWHWYALDVVRQKEYVAGLILQRHGCATFIPTEMRFRRKNRFAKSKIEVAHAALPGVVFAGFPDEPRWRDVMSMHLVNGVLSTDGRPRRIDTASEAWIQYRDRQLDGALTVERHRVAMKVKGEEVEVEKSFALVSVQGRGVIRSPLSLKVKASSDRPLVIPVAGQRARELGAILAASAGVLAKAA